MAHPNSTIGDGAMAHRKGGRRLILTLAWVSLLVGITVLVSYGPGRNLLQGAMNSLVFTITQMHLGAGRTDGSATETITGELTKLLDSHFENVFLVPGNQYAGTFEVRVGSMSIDVYMLANPANTDEGEQGNGSVGGLAERSYLNGEQRIWMEDVEDLGGDISVISDAVYAFDVCIKGEAKVACVMFLITSLGRDQADVALEALEQVCQRIEEEFDIVHPR